MLCASNALATHVPVLGEVFERTALGLRDQESREDTCKHECRENLHNMIEPWVGIAGILGAVATSPQWRNSTLCDDAANLTHAGRNTVGSRSVACGEAFSWNNESGGIWTPVEEQLNEDVNGQHGMVAELVIGETPNDEEDCKEAEANELQWLASNEVDSSNSKPVSRECSSDDENATTRGEIVESVVDGSGVGISNGLEYYRLVQAEAVLVPLATRSLI